MTAERRKSDPGAEPASPLLYLKFIIPSLIGAFVFLTPVTHNGKQTIVMGVLAEWMMKPLAGVLPTVVVGITVISAAAAIVYLLLNPKDWARRRPLLYAVSHVTPVWALLRTLGAVFGVMFIFQLGPQAVWGKQTGGAVFVDIGTNMVVIFLQACFLMPFLTEYGFMEFAGTLVRKAFRKLFRLPGRAAIDATASFVAAASVGLLITINQFERGYYSARESAVIATNFSVVSVPFALLIANVAGLEDIFFSWYGTVVIACLICAFVTPRLPPLSRKKDTYYEPVGRQIHELAEGDETLLQWSITQAVAKAKGAPGVGGYLRTSSRQALDVVFGVVPPTMGLALLTAMLVFHSDVFHVLSYPIRLLLELAGLPEAKMAAPGFIVGFLDQFMPAIIASNIDSQVTRFLLAGLSVGQLIYLSEVGVLILRSSLPLSFGDLAWIFALRTVLLFPVFLVAAKILT